MALYWISLTPLTYNNICAVEKGAELFETNTAT